VEVDETESAQPSVSTISDEWLPPKKKSKLARILKVSNDREHRKLTTWWAYYKAIIFCSTECLFANDAALNCSSMVIAANVGYLRKSLLSYSFLVQKPSYLLVGWILHTIQLGGGHTRVHAYMHTHRQQTHNLSKAFSCQCHLRGHAAWWAPGCLCATQALGVYKHSWGRTSNLQGVVRVSEMKMWLAKVPPGLCETWTVGIYCTSPVTRC